MTNSNQKERFQTKIAMLEQNNQVLHNKCEEYLDKLDRRRKALDVAVDAIDKILVLNSGKFIQEPVEMWKIAKSAKDKITALEQKDVE